MVQVAIGLAHLLAPLQWECAHIPTLPSTLDAADMLGCPNPFIVGILVPLAVDTTTITDVSVLWLDGPTPHLVIAPDCPPIKPSPELAQAIEAITNPRCSLLSTAVLLNAGGRPDLLLNLTGTTVGWPTSERHPPLSCVVCCLPTVHCHRRCRAAGAPRRRAALRPSAPVCSRAASRRRSWTASPACAASSAPTSNPSAETFASPTPGGATASTTAMPMVLPRARGVSSKQWRG